MRPQTSDDNRGVMADSEGRADDQEKADETESSRAINGSNKPDSKTNCKPLTTTQYCEKLQEWMWQYYCGYMNWQSWVTVFPFSPFPTQTATGTPGPPTWGAEFPNADLRSWFGHSFGASLTSNQLLSLVPTTPANNTTQRGTEVNGQTPSVPAHPPAQQNGTAQQPGREYSIPSPFHRFLAEMVDFFILFFIKATIILSIIHLSGLKDISKFAMHFIVEEIDEDTTMEELQKMMLVALVYRILVCFYEIICIWGAGGATPGKFLLGLRVITCDTSVLVQPNRVRVVPATNVSLSASTIRALNKNFSIAFFFPAFITLLFFQHNRTVYDIVAGTIVVKRNRLR